MQEIKCSILDKGFVTLIDMMGDDFSAVKAARVSYAKEQSPDIERDRALIEYLMKNKHESPFEHITLTFHVKCPIFVARQWLRHRIGNSYNEISRRYTTKYSEEFYLPDHIRVQDEENRQSSYICEDDNKKEQALLLIEESYKNAYETYQKLLKLGIAREMARIVLPVGEYTQFYWTSNIRSIMHFLNLRADGHAQYEIQLYAKAIAEIFSKVCPLSYTAFLKYSYTGNILKEV